MPLKDYLATLDVAALPETFIDDISREFDADSADSLNQIAGLTAELEAVSGNANTLAAEMEELRATLTTVQAHNYELLTNGGDIPAEVTVEGDGEDVIVESDPVLDVFFTDL